MPFQYPKAMTVKYAKEKLGSDQEFTNFFTKIGEINTAVDDLDKDSLKDMDIRPVQNKFKELTTLRNTAKTKLEKKANAKTGNENDKKAAAQLVDKLDALSIELDTASKVINNQLLTLIKEHSQDKTWDSVEKTNESDIKLIKSLGAQNMAAVKKATESLAKIKSEFDKLGEKPDAAGPELKKYQDEKKKLVEQLDDVETKAKRNNTTGVVGYPSYEEACKSIRAKLLLVKMSDKEAKSRDEFFKSMDKIISEAIKRREPIIRVFGAVRMLLARD